MTEKMLIFHTKHLGSLRHPIPRDLLRHIYERVSIFLSHLLLRCACPFLAVVPCRRQNAKVTSIWSSFAIVAGLSHDLLARVVRRSGLAQIGEQSRNSTKQRDWHGVSLVTNFLTPRLIQEETDKHSRVLGKRLAMGSRKT
jgi:hypothetical protein